MATPWKWTWPSHLWRNADSVVIGTVEVARDISRERALEAQLAEAQRMEAVGRLRAASPTTSTTS